MRITLIALFAALVFSGCATYSSGFATVERDLASDRAEAALASLEKIKVAERDRLLYLLNKAMILQTMHENKASGEAFEQAKALIVEYDALSVSEQVSSMLINDAMAAYSGEDYERVYLNFYSALNYLALGDLYGARVEALQADVALRGADTGEYDKDAAMRYLSGIIYEALGETNDALVSYRIAYSDYKNGFFGVAVPHSLGESLLRLTSKLAISAEHKRYQAEFPKIADFKALGKNEGELVVIASVGFAPIKRANDLTTDSPVGLIRISIPSYESRAKPFTARLVIDDRAQPMEIISDIESIATNALSAHMAAIIARTVARIATKKIAENVAAQAAGNGKDNTGALVTKLALSLFNAATEVADTRSWLTLPSTIRLARVKLTAGDHTVRVVGDGGAYREYTVHINAGETVFLTPHLYL
ncbi:hypothetical protein AGMMS50229_19660 [Campylobacterota bacterium]|nr:hypothetical protein AGMMS50229_19660 [Campylobacterota bacterium]